MSNGFEANMVAKRLERMTDEERTRLQSRFYDDPKAIRSACNDCVHRQAHMLTYLDLGCDIYADGIPREYFFDKTCEDFVDCNTEQKD